MAVDPEERQVAEKMFAYAVELAALRNPDCRELAVAAARTPTTATVKALLEALAGRECRRNLVEALAQAGVAAVEDVLGGSNG
jgi:hypothetical protein